MYDISGVPDAEVEEAIKADYLHLVRVILLSRAGCPY
jgi:hypothetical protein